MAIRLGVTYGMFAFHIDFIDDRTINKAAGLHSANEWKAITDINNITTEKERTTITNR